MNVCRNLMILANLTPLVAAIWGVGAIARPYPDELGICYRFDGDILVQHEPCIISAGYGAGAHYVILHWSDDSSTAIYMINNCFHGQDGGQELDDLGFCAYQVDEAAAVPYERDVFFNVATGSSPDNMICYRAIAPDESVCYRYHR